MKRYQVIGGQYESCWYGESDSLRGAKTIAKRNEGPCPLHYMDRPGGESPGAVLRAHRPGEVLRAHRQAPGRVGQRLRAEGSESPHGEGIGIFDTIYEVASTLNHTLVYKLLEWFFLYAYTEVVEELVPETRVNQVTGSMFSTTYIEVNILPIVVCLFRYQSFGVVRIHVADVVS